MSENASRDALSGRIGLFGRAIRPARSTTRGSEAEIAWKVAFGCFSLTGGKPNGECRLIETAKLNDVDPQGWLADTLARIPDCKITKVDDLLPWNMGSHHHMKDAA